MVNEGRRVLRACLDATRNRPRLQLPHRNECIRVSFDLSADLKDWPSRLHRVRRQNAMVKIIDDDFLAVMRELPEEWAIERFDRMGMGWVARISNRKSVFQLVSDRGYIGVERLVDGKFLSIDVPQHLRVSISAKQVAELVVQHAA